MALACDHLNEYFLASNSEYPLSSGFSPLLNSNGVLVDSLKQTFGTVVIGYPVCSNTDLKNGYYFYADHSTPQPFMQGVCKLSNNLNIEVLNTIKMPDGFGLPQAICQNNQYVFYVQYQVGLFRLDKNTHEVVKLMNNCVSRYIRSLSMSPDGNTILFERVRGHQVYPGEGLIDEQSEVWRYNVITGREAKVLWE